MPDDSDHDDAEIGKLVGQYLDRINDGESIDPEEILGEHPELGRAILRELETFVDLDTEADPEKESSLALGPLGDYELLEEIGRGGMGVVYRARQVSLNRIVALKMILGGESASAPHVKRFLSEAEAIAELDHPNIVPIHDVGEHQGRHYFTMKLIEGSSLERKIREFTRDPRATAQLMATVARAVHRAHQRGILHRDLKPANILLGDGGKPYVTDFGLAKRIETDSGLTQSGMVVGTPSYMPPEQVSCEKGLTTGADVYSLGAVLYEMLTGRPPFRGKTTIETLRQVMEREPKRPRAMDASIDLDLETISLKCLDKKPERRYGSAEALADDLERFLDSKPIEARPITAPERVMKWARRRPSHAALVIVLLLAVVTIIGGAAWSNRQRAEELENTQLALAKLVAERLDDFQKLAAAPQILRILLEETPGLGMEELHGCLRRLVARNPDIYGMCVAFKSGQLADAHYFIHGNAKKTPLGYDPETKEWFTIPRDSGKELWIDPFFDANAGKVWMTTFAVPFLRDGAFAGVVTVDLSINHYVQMLRDGLKGLDHEGAYGFLVDPNDRIIGHPLKPIEEVENHGFETLSAHEDLAELATRLSVEDGGGLVTARDPWYEGDSTFVFSTVPSVGWFFVAVIPERARDSSPTPRGKWE